MRWEQRVHYHEPIGNLQPYLVDVYDVFLSKLYSIREKDLDDLRVLKPRLDKDILVRMLLGDTASMLASSELKARAEKNWYVLFGEPLPS